MNSVDIKNLSLSFGDVNVLESLNLAVTEGELLVLLGPSGCGKSTLLNCIAGLLDINAGQVHINERNVTWLEPKDRGIGMVFQSYALYPQMSVRKNLSFGLRVAGLPRTEITERVKRAAEILQIEPLLDRKPAALSGGQRQRVAIGRALVRDVDVFLFDEPLSNLDAKLRTDLRVEIKRLHQRLNNTMIYVTHDQVEAMTLADRIAIMKDGVIQQLDAPKTVYGKPCNRFVAGFIGSPTMNFLPGKLSTSAGAINFVSGDFTMPLEHYAFIETPVDEMPVELGIRPEHVSIGQSNAVRTCESAITIELLEPMGADTIVWSSLAGCSFTVRTDAEDQLAVDQQITVGFDVDNTSLFSLATGDRL